MSSKRNYDWAIILAVCALCFLVKLGSVGLFDFNEGLYVQAAREMAMRGNYVTPTVNGVFFFDKPPLALWESAACLTLIGRNEFAARLPVAVAAILLTLLTWWFGIFLFGRKTGLLAGLFVSLNPLVVGTARQMTMDIHQSLWFAVAMVCFYMGDGEKRRTEGDRKYRTFLWYMGFWGACGLSFLSKSVPGLFPIFLVFIYTAIRERGRPLAVLRYIWSVYSLPGILLLACVILPWHLLAYRANGPVFYQEYWVLHHVKLFNATEFSHAHPFWYYAPMLIAGFIPWSLFTPPAVWAIFRDKQNRTNYPLIFVSIWAIGVFVIFSCMKSKLISYLLPMYPAEAIITANWVARRLEDGKTRWLTGATTTFAVLITVAAVFGSSKLYHVKEMPPELAAFGMHVLVMLSATSILSAGLLLTKRTVLGIGALTGTMIVFVGLCIFEGFPTADRIMIKPLHILAAHAGSVMETGTPVAFHFGTRRPSALFYMPDDVFSRQPMPTAEREIPTVPELREDDEIRAFVTSHQTACILTELKYLDRLLAMSPDLHVIEHRGSFFLVGKGRVTFP